MKAQVRSMKAEVKFSINQKTQLALVAFSAFSLEPSALTSGESL